MHGMGLNNKDMTPEEMKRPKIDFLKMSNPNYDSWHKFANECYSYMDYKEVQAKTIERSLNIQAQMYGEFCAICEREGMPLIKFEDYLKLDR